VEIRRMVADKKIRREVMAVMGSYWMRGDWV